MAFAQFKRLAAGLPYLMVCALVACSGHSTPPPRPEPAGLEVIDTAESTAHFGGTFEEAGALEQPTLLTPVDKGSFGEGQEIYLGDHTISEETSYVEDLQTTDEVEGAAIVVTEQQPATRPHENLQDLQSTMKDIQLPEQAFSSSNFDLYAEYGTGAKMNDSLYYTDASVDGLIHYLRDTLTRTADRSFSHSLQGVRISNLDRVRGDHTLELSLRGGAQNLSFEGRADVNGLITYTATSAGASNLTVRGICLDTYNHCFNILILVQKNEGSSVRTGFVVHRLTPGSVFLDVYSGYLAGSPADRWTSFIQNTKTHRQSIDSGRGETALLNRMQYFTMKSTASLFGESRFDTEMEILRPNLCTELVVLNGPLVKSLDQNQFRLPLQEPPTQVILRDGRTVDELGLYMGEIQSASLMNNNGTGDLRLKLAVKNSVASDTIELTYQRKHVQTDLSRACYLYPIENLCVITPEAIAPRLPDPMER